MRVVIAVIVLAVSLPVNGCSRPQQAYAKRIWLTWVNPQSLQRPQLIKVSSVKLPQPNGKSRQPIQARSVKQHHAVRSIQEPKASSAQPPAPLPRAPLPPAPLPQRKPEQPPTNASVPPGEVSNTVEQQREAKFKAAEAKAKREGVDSLTSEDIDGLSREELKVLRGY